MASAKNTVKYEKVDYQSFSPYPIIGVDEVGRGCLAGPVYAGAVILKSDLGLERLTDSKLIVAEKRTEISEEIKKNHLWSIGIASVEEIEELNILKASLLAMKRAVEGLNVQGGHCLVDGNFIIPNLPNVYKQTAIVKGDLRAAPISAAAIIAKVARDGLMQELVLKYPNYGFENHKGYATPEHKKAIAKWGTSVIHRKTFAGVKEYL